ncbi:hypothetical protein BCR33DRAFT_711877 [Rhizoclosmatium globosum]|uniref:Uncharacterized protein n=1 Tax=Rhizoclosmatium globosum TaxID=329046 RepID=A0A1Y2D009_9FUNG|nr:hypothetical protein BCR33DRAFT_711877 [Rhizoclosmatium globosum]|eukprot:ORY52611.1 hypothetical protein BCR33DRAFT_711877 [Rhizoclosmatium globosum]
MNYHESQSLQMRCVEGFSAVATDQPTHQRKHHPSLDLSLGNRPVPHFEIPEALELKMTSVTCISNDSHSAPALLAIIS